VYFTAGAVYIRSQAQIYNNKGPLSIAFRQNFHSLRVNAAVVSAILVLLNLFESENL
jgi:hypothetical protein